MHCKWHATHCFVDIRIHKHFERERKRKKEIVTIKNSHILLYKDLELLQNTNLNTFIQFTLTLILFNLFSFFQRPLKTIPNN